jgi:galactokinase
MKPTFAEAPGRLDFLGGVADYSGSLVLQMPLTLKTRVALREHSKQQLLFTSSAEGRCVVPWNTAPKDVPKWARYSYGCFLHFRAAHGWAPMTGLRFDIASKVPISMGVGSSAALEVATLRALEAFTGKRFRGTALSHLAQHVENTLVGAPCGLMDPLAVAHGVPGELLPIFCRPDQLRPSIKLPKGVVAVGWPSGVRHAVTEQPYATARTAAFMGRALAEMALERVVAHATEFSPSEIRSLSLDELPETLTGAQFLARCGELADPFSVIDLRREYPVRAGLLFPVEENFRVHAAVALLDGFQAGRRQETLRILGELLYQSHAGYSLIGLGSPGTDTMVAAIRSLGPDHGFYGARASGGGSGGTVAVLLEESALPKLRALATTTAGRKNHGGLLR